MENNGPWKLVEDGNTASIVASNGYVICEFELDTDFASMRAAELQHARLIAASPAMLEALKEAQEGFELVAEHCKDMHARALAKDRLPIVRAAIQSATEPPK